MGKKRRKKNYDIPKDELEELYLNQKKTMQEIAEIFNCSRDTIRERIIENDI